MNEPDPYELFERLKQDLLIELAPPWWERWVLLGSFFLGVIVGYFFGQWMVL